MANFEELLRYAAIFQESSQPMTAHPVLRWALPNRASGNGVLAMNKRKPRSRASSTIKCAAMTLDRLKELERKVLWLSCWMIHNANHVRPSRDGLKVGGHQASCASAVTLLTALYMHVLKPEE